MSWADFYVTVATAAATILGLLFVAVQFNLERVPADRSHVWLATARSTWIVLASLFFVALVYLIPGSTALNRVLGTGVVLVYSARRIVATWSPARKAVGAELEGATARTLWVMVAPLAFYALLFAYTAVLAHGGVPPSGIAYVFIGLFALALRNSWDLLVELRVEGGTHDDGAGQQEAVAAHARNGP